MQVICSECGKNNQELADLLFAHLSTIEKQNLLINQLKEMLKQNDETITSYHNMSSAYLKQIQELGQELNQTKSNLALRNLELMNKY